MLKISVTLKRLTNTLFLLIGLLFLSPVNAQWNQLGEDINGEAIGDAFGQVVSISGDGQHLAVGTPNNAGKGTFAGHVRVYTLTANNWVQQGNDIDAEAEGDASGQSVSINEDGTIVAVGAPFNDGNGFNAGHVRVFRLTSGNWVQLGNDIDGENTDDAFGQSISMSANGFTIAIGSPFTTSVPSGQVKVFQIDAGDWLQLGGDINGEAFGDGFGSSVSLSADGKVLAVGAPNNAGTGPFSGHVRVFKLGAGNSWEQLGEDIDAEAVSDLSGSAISLSADGSTVAIGATGNNGNSDGSGHVRVFKFSSDSWSQIGNDIDGEATGDGSGQSVSLNADGTILAIGAANNAGNGDASGHTRVFSLSSGQWVQLGEDMDGEAAGDASGYAVSLSDDGTRVAIGAINNDGTGLNAGHVRVYSSVTTSTREIVFNSNSKIYPNPAEEMATIDLRNAMGNVYISVVEINGKEVFSLNNMVGSETISLPLDRLNKGIYFVKIEHNHRREIIKLIKQ